MYIKVVLRLGLKMSANGLHRIRWRRVAVSRLHYTHRKSVHESLSKYASKWCCGSGGKCRQPDSIGSDGDGLPCQDSIGLTASLFARDLANNIKVVLRLGWKMLANGLHRIRWWRVAVTDSIEWGLSQFARDLVNIQSRVVRIYQQTHCSKTRQHFKVSLCFDEFARDIDNIDWCQHIKVNVESLFLWLFCRMRIRSLVRASANSLAWSIGRSLLPSFLA